MSSEDVRKAVQRVNSNRKLAGQESFDLKKALKSNPELSHIINAISNQTDEAEVARKLKEDILQPFRSGQGLPEVSKEIVELAKSEEEKENQRKAEEEQKRAALNLPSMKTSFVGDKAHPNFVGCGEDLHSLEIWRIENLEPVKWPKNLYGKFYTGDSYIVLYTGKIAGRGRYRDLHFWLGSQSTQDEQAAAAYRTVELDEYLKGTPVQHREVQFHESDLFLSYFKQFGGVEYMDGGFDSAFSHVEKDKYDTRLLQLKGRRNVRVLHRLVSHKSLNGGDVFILDAGLKIFQWNGKKASSSEKSKGLTIAKKLRDEERGGRAEIILADEGNEPPDFWTLLGGKGPVASAEEGGDDLEFEKKSHQNMKLYHVSDASGVLKVEEIAKRPYTRDLLDSNDCFILDCDDEVFVWVGKGSTQQEKKESVATAQSFLKQKGRPEWTRITRVVEDGETPLFRDKFSNWKDKNSAPVLGQQDSWRQLTERNQKRQLDRQTSSTVDVKNLHLQVERTESRSTIPVCNEEIKIWRIEDFQMVQVHTDNHGIFFSGDSYVIHHRYDEEVSFDAYVSKRKRRDIIYMWQGQHSTFDEKGSSAWYAVKLDEELEGMATQVRVVQNKEPEHFLKMLKGKMIVRHGGYDNGKEQINETSLFHIKGTNDHNTRAVEIQCSAKSLNSNDAFVLTTPKDTFLWFGKGASDRERELARNVAVALSKNKAHEIEEGNEPAGFWEPLGGKGEYASDSHLHNTVVAEPRLFQCSNATGLFKVEEVFNFSQEDLDNDDVFLLDAFYEVFVWVGWGANLEEKKRSFETAMEYVQLASDGRPSNTPIHRVFAGHEPATFRSYFIGWDFDKASLLGSKYEQKLKEMDLHPKPVSEALNELTQQKFHLHQLQSTTLPEGVDNSRLEDYLFDNEFKDLFKISREEFSRFPRWKREQEKRKIGLF